jgi:hypothetical protein
VWHRKRISKKAIYVVFFVFVAKSSPFGECNLVLTSLTFYSYWEEKDFYRLIFDIGTFMALTYFHVRSGFNWHKAVQLHCVKGTFGKILKIKLPTPRRLTVLHSLLHYQTLIALYWGRPQGADHPPFDAGKQVDIIWISKLLPFSPLNRWEI